MFLIDSKTGETVEMPSRPRRRVRRRLARRTPKDESRRVPSLATVRAKFDNGEFDNTVELVHSNRGNPVRGGRVTWTKLSV